MKKCKCESIINDIDKFFNSQRIKKLNDNILLDSYVKHVPEIIDEIRGISRIIEDNYTKCFCEYSETIRALNSVLQPLYKMNTTFQIDYSANAYNNIVYDIYVAIRNIVASRIRETNGRKRH